MNFNTIILRNFIVAFALAFLSSGSYATTIGGDSNLNPIGYYQIDSVYQLETHKELYNYKNVFFQNNWLSYYDFIPRLTNDGQWRRFSIKNISANKHWNIIIGDREVSRDFELYVFNSRDLVHKFEVDDIQKTGPYKMIRSPVTLKQNEHYTVLIKDESFIFSPFNIMLATNAMLNERESYFNLVEGLIIGFIFSMLFYNFSLFTKTREKSYFYYTSFHLIILIYQMYILGLLPTFVTSSMFWGEQHTSIFLTGSLFVAGHLFTLKFLNVKNTLKPLFAPILIGAFLWSFYTLACFYFIDNYYLGIAFTFLSASSFIIGIFLGFTLWMRGYGEAKYYTLSWLAFLCFYTTDKLSQLNVLPFYLDDFHLTNFGFVAESIIMSIAPLEIIKQLKIKNERESDEIEQSRIQTQMKSDFLSSMTHEIKTPMNGILGVTELLKDSNLTQEQEEYIETIDSSGKNLMSIIQDILNYSKTESGNIQLEDQDFRFQEMIDDVISIFRTQYFNTNIPLFIEIDPQIPHFVRGDGEKIKQVLINLISNAYKFTKEGQIVLKASYKGKDAFYHNTIEFSVIDSGIGLTDEEKGQLFAPFQQANDSITRKYGGTGLGLAISKNIVELMDGNIGVESLKGQGSEFYFTINVQDSLHFDYPESWIDIEQLKNSRLLLASKNTFLINSIKLTFKRFNIEVDVVDLIDKHKIEQMVSQYDIAFIDKKTNKQTIEHIEMFSNHYRDKVVFICQRFSKERQFYELEEVFTSDNLLITTLRAFKNKILDNISQNQRNKKDNHPQYNKEKQPKEFNFNVLIAEDDRATQIIIKQQLKKLNANVTICNNGQEAYNEFKEHPDYDLILTDYQMPIMNGFEFTQAIRDIEQEKNFSRSIIICLSADEDSFDKNDYYSIGGSESLTKPLNEAAITTISCYLKSRAKFSNQ